MPNNNELQITDSIAVEHAGPCHDVCLARLEAGDEAAAHKPQRDSYLSVRYPIASLRCDWLRHTAHLYAPCARRPELCATKFSPHSYYCNNNAKCEKLHG